MLVCSFIHGCALIRLHSLSARASYDFVFAENGLTAFHGTTELKGGVRLWEYGTVNRYAMLHTLDSEKILCCTSISYSLSSLRPNALFFRFLLSRPLDLVQSILEFLGEERMQEFINFTLHYIADLKIPQKRLEGGCGKYKREV